MKKSLFAIAAIGAFAGAAQAQSSVTVYGILDVGFTGTTSRIAGPEVPSAVKTNTTAFSGTGSESTSRLGFRGTEDLGGGTRAFFTAEFGVAPTSWNLSGNDNDGLFNRQTFVGLAQKGIGQAAIGTQYTPVHVAVGRTDPGQTNNIQGNLVYSVDSATGSTMSTMPSYSVRYNNALTLQTERISGFQLSAIYNNSNSNSNNPASIQTVGNNQAYGLGLNFVWNKLNIDVATNQSRQQAISGSAVQTAYGPSAAVRNSAVPNLLGNNVNWGQTYVGATYDFGIFTAYAQYLSSKMVSNANDQAYVQRNVSQIGIRSYVTKTVEAWASGGMGRLSAGGLSTFASNSATGAASSQNALATTTRTTSDLNGYQLGANYWLSKRTNMYAIFGQQVRSQTASISAAGQSSYGLGLRHTF
jgi:predicted porin